MCHHGASLCRLVLLLLAAEEVVGDGVQEGADDGDRAASHLDGCHALAECDGAADNDDRTVRANGRGEPRAREG